MDLIVKKSTALSGNVTPPGSKSQTIRALILSLLANGESVIQNRLDACDVSDAMHVLETLGCTLTHDKDRTVVQSCGMPLEVTTKQIYSGNSGITTHFIMPLLGLRKHPDMPIIFDCGEQMRARPVDSLIQALNSLGMSIKHIEKPNALPLSISGELEGGKAEVSGLTSQYISALLLALPCAKKDSEITVKNLHERPYMDMTLAWLRKQNIEFAHEIFKDSDVFAIKGMQRYKNFSVSIPCDFSSASYLMAAAVLTQSEVKISGIDMQDTQGDKRLISILQEMGADLTVKANEVYIRGGKCLTGINVDANDIPDLVPTLAVIGTQAKGSMEISNIKHIKIKETDRIHSMLDGLTRMGATISESNAGIIVHESKLKAANVRGYGDHRTVMALAIAGLVAEGETHIDDYESVNKTFPAFVSTMQSLGANMEIQFDYAE